MWCVVVLGVCWGMNVCLYGVCGPEVPGSEHDVWIGLGVLSAWMP